MPTDTRKITGIRGEEEAARFLARSGLAIVDRNVRTRVGEIDLVAKEGKTLVFVEVKTRRDLENAPPPQACLLYTSPSPRDRQKSRMPSSA